jgi:HK97 family phage major capsid protein
MTPTAEIIRYINTGQFDATRAAAFDLQRAKGTLKASFAPQKNVVVDEDKRTVEFSFASGDAIEHWFGYTVLDLSKDAADLERVKNGVCPFLVNHDRDDQIGVVLDCEADGNVIRGTVKFSRSARGDEMFQDVKDSIRNGTSIGFLVQDMILTEQKEGEIPTYTITKWTMLENSLASIPADISVGARRQLETSLEVPETGNSNTGERQMPNEEIATATATPTAGSPAVERSADVIAAERTAAIIDFATCFGDAAVATARQMLVASPDITLEDVRAAIRAAQPPTVVVPPLDPQTAAERGGAGPQTGIQLARTLPRYGTLRNFTGADAAERAYRFGQWVLGVRGLSAGLSTEGGFARAAAFCKENGIVLTRAMSEGVNESGGFLVPEEFGNDLIDLREIYGVFRKNAKMVPMSSDTRSDPRRTGGLTAYFAGEGDALTASDKAWDRVELTAKKLTILSRYSNELNEDAVINLGDDLAGEIAYAFALKEDQCGFVGDGTSTYGGMQGVCTKIKGLSGTIANIAGLVVGAGNAYSELVLTDFEAVAAKLPVYADTPRAKWYCHKSVYWNVMVKLALAAGGATGSETTSGVAKRFLGYDVEFVQVMPSVEANSQVCALLGDLTLAASFGSRRDTTIAISEHSRFANDQLEIRGTERFDINVHDVGNASATAGLRVPGPIVGLITAAS